VERDPGRAVTRVAASAAAVARLAVDFLLPRACAVCQSLLDERERGIVCGRCWSRIEHLPAPRCERCGHPNQRAACAWCRLLPPYVRAARSVCWMHRGAGAEIVHALKYGGWHAVADGIAERMARLAWPEDVVEERSMIVPVPLSASRLRERGYNQSARIADALASRWRIPARDDLLVRARATETQTKLTPEQRLANVSNAFRVAARAASAFRNAHVVVVDDVITTAATLNACAAALFAGGARIVSYVTFGRAPAAGDR
jgi:ComF family protein